jgi:hypothetical protein
MKIASDVYQRGTAAYPVDEADGRLRRPQLIGKALGVTAGVADDKL